MNQDELILKLLEIKKNVSNENCIIKGNILIIWPSINNSRKLYKNHILDSMRK